MKRKIYNELLNWKQTKSQKGALLIDGARSVGKSYIVEEFAKNEYRSYIMINFGKMTTEMREIFDNCLTDLDALFMRLSLWSSKQLYYFSSNNRENSEKNMEIDFLNRKPNVTSRHNICHVEVKSTKRYTTSSLEKLRKNSQMNCTQVHLHVG